MRDNVKWPLIPREEFRHRIENTQRLLAASAMDAMVLFAPANWWYYAGWTDAGFMHCPAWRCCVIVLPDRDPVIVAHGAYAYFGIASSSWVDDVRPWSEEPIWATPHSDFWVCLFDTLADLNLSDKVLGVETGPQFTMNYLSIDEYRQLQSGLPNAEIVSADDFICAQIAVKTAWEVETIREGCRRACVAHRAAFDAIRPGMKERDFHRVFWRACADLGMLDSPQVSTWIAFSTNAGESPPSHRWITRPLDRTIEYGDFGMSDFGPSYQGYRTDFQRNFYVGKPPKKQLEIYRQAVDAHCETMDVIKPGIAVCEIREAGMAARRKRDQAPLIDFDGHSMGLMNDHLPPWIRADEKTVVQPGMVFMIEIGIFDPANEVGGGMPEDIVLVTEDGYENLTRYLSHDLYIVP
ncbi:MAG: Xaa-Pro peptidase family protein [Gammaproteobacteria bacterium]|nr:Xaa-Pro peptidase family protein [Gammaproteobacteria bacterium]